MKKILVAILLGLTISQLIKNSSLRPGVGSGASRDELRLPSATAVTEKAKSNTLTTPPIAAKTDSPSEHIERLTALAEAMQHHNMGSSADIDAETLKLAQELTVADGKELQTTALNEQLTHTARFLSVSLMSQNPRLFSAQLEEIVKTPWSKVDHPAAAHTEEEAQHHFEEALRVQAMAGLDQLNKDGHKEGAFFATLETNSNQLIRKLARMGALGAEHGQTLINQYIETEL